MHNSYRPWKLRGNAAAGYITLYENNIIINKIRILSKTIRTKLFEIQNPVVHSGADCISSVLSLTHLQVTQYTDTVPMYKLLFKNDLT
jgi:hypothetical protein